MRIRDFGESPVLLALHRAEDQHDILRRHWHACFENVLQQFAAFVQTKFEHEEFDQVAVAAIANRFVVEVLHLARERFGQRADATRGVEGFVVHAVEAEGFVAFQWQHFQQLAAAHGFARVAVFVDQAVRAPREVVLHLVGGEDGQGTDAQADFVQFVEVFGEMVGCD
ncbi:MAG: hypothetical protein QM770_17830 [Tepidisphaeraceae bacterium]